MTTRSNPRLRLAAGLTTAGLVLAGLVAVPAAAYGAPSADVDTAVLHTEGVTRHVTWVDEYGAPTRTVSYSPEDEFPAHVALGFRNDPLTSIADHSVEAIEDVWVGPAASEEPEAWMNEWCLEREVTPTLRVGDADDSLTPVELNWLPREDGRVSPILAPIGHAIYALGYDDVATCMDAAHLTVEIDGDPRARELSTIPIDGHFLDRAVPMTHGEGTPPTPIIPGVARDASLVSGTGEMEPGLVASSIKLIDDATGATLHETTPGKASFAIPAVAAGKSVTLNVNVGMREPEQPVQPEQPEDGPDEPDYIPLGVPAFDRPVTALETGLGAGSVVEVHGLNPTALDLAPFEQHLSDEVRNLAATSDDPEFGWVPHADVDESIEMHRAAAWATAHDEVAAQIARGVTLRDDGVFELAVGEQGEVAFVGEQFEVVLPFTGVDGEHDPRLRLRSAAVTFTDNFKALSPQQRLQVYTGVGVAAGQGDFEGDFEPLDFAESEWSDFAERYDAPSEHAAYGFGGHNAVGPSLFVAAHLAALPGEIEPPVEAPVEPVDRGSETGAKPDAGDERRTPLAATGGGIEPATIVSAIAMLAAGGAFTYCSLRARRT